MCLNEFRIYFFVHLTLCSLGCRREDSPGEPYVPLDTTAPDRWTEEEQAPPDVTASADQLAEDGAVWQTDVERVDTSPGFTDPGGEEDAPVEVAAFDVLTLPSEDLTLVEDDASPSPDPCAACEAPYPGCAQYNGFWVCVQCTEDAHCKNGPCRLATYECPPVTDCPGACDLGLCEAAGLECDEAIQACWSKTGVCDNVTIFCTNGGVCIDPLGQLGLLLPGPPVMPASCTCVPGPDPGHDAGDCPAVLYCAKGPLGALVSLWGGDQAFTCRPEPDL